MDEIFPTPPTGVNDPIVPQVPPVTIPTPAPLIPPVNTPEPVQQTVPTVTLPVSTESLLPPLASVPAPTPVMPITTVTAPVLPPIVTPVAVGAVPTKKKPMFGLLIILVVFLVLGVSAYYIINGGQAGVVTPTPTPTPTASPTPTIAERAIYFDHYYEARLSATKKTGFVQTEKIALDGSKIELATVAPSIKSLAVVINTLENMETDDSKSVYYSASPDGMYIVRSDEGNLIQVFSNAVVPVTLSPSLFSTMATAGTNEKIYLIAVTNSGFVYTSYIGNLVRLKMMTFAGVEAFNMVIPSFSSNNRVTPVAKGTDRLVVMDGTALSGYSFGASYSVDLVGKKVSKLAFNNNIEYGAVSVDAAKEEFTFLKIDYKKKTAALITASMIDGATVTQTVINGFDFDVKNMTILEKSPVGYYVMSGVSDTVTKVYFLKTGEKTFVEVSTIGAPKFSVDYAFCSKTGDVCVQSTSKVGSKTVYELFYLNGASVLKTASVTSVAEELEGTSITTPRIE